MKPTVAVTMGDPAGVGPELCLRAVKDADVLERCVPLIVGDASVLQRVSDVLGLECPLLVIRAGDWRDATVRGDTAIVDCGALHGETVTPGRVDRECGRASCTYIETAVEAAVAGRVAAVTTGPISKESLHLADVPYPGHTEMLAALTGSKRFGMMLASEEIKVSLATIHVGYADVVRQLTRERIVETVELTVETLARLGHPEPLIAVCGLNPHGGEHGLMGSEEQDIIAPAIGDCRRGGISLEGPLAPDTAFVPAMRSRVDAYVAMYHDQGLIPFKMLAFDVGVNMTMGLPILRTSVDHGTAFDIAWKGRASPGSLVQSILWAVRLAGSER